MRTRLTDDDLDVYGGLTGAACKLGKDFRFEVEDGGHNLHFDGHHFTPFDLVMAVRRDDIFSKNDAEGLIRAWAEGVPVTDLTFIIPATEHTAESTHPHHRIPFSISRYNGPEKCSDCGHRDFFTDGFKIWPSRSCPIPEGISLKVEVPIPSGRLMVGNDFRDEFPVEEDDFYVNEPSEIARCVQAYAKVGMFHFFVGNTCPGVYRKSDDPNHLIVANPAFSEDESVDEEEDDFDSIDGFQSQEASVCTDLWWVSMVDADEAEKRGLSTDGPGWTQNDVIEVEPGIYELEYHGLKRDFDRDSNSTWNREEGYVPTPVIYATLTRKGDIT